MAIGASRLGAKPPEVTLPIGWPDADRISVPSRAGARPSGRMPTRLRAGPSAQLALDARGAGEAALGPPPLADRPCQPGLDRRRRLVDVVAVEAEAGLEPQRIAGAEADRLCARIAGQPLPKRRRMIGMHSDLEAVLAGVAGAADVALDAVERHDRRCHERELACGREQRADDVDGGRTLHGDQCVVRPAEQAQTGREIGFDVGEIGVLARCVDDEHEAARVRRRRRGASPSGRRGCRRRRSAIACSVAGPARGPRCRPAPGVSSVAATVSCRPSSAMRIAQPMWLTSKMPAFALVHRCSAIMPSAILHRHLVAGERHDTRAARYVRVVEGRAVESGRAHGRHLEQTSCRETST